MSLRFQELDDHVLPEADESAEVSTSSDPVPLVVDVDGTLLRTDLSIESLLSFIQKAPTRILELVLWLVAGKASLKDRIAENVSLPTENLPFNEQVLDFMRVEKEAGRPIYLASASDHRHVKALADHLGFVDGDQCSVRGCSNIEVKAVP